MSKLLIPSFQRALKVDGQHNRDADNAHNHKVDGDVPLKGQVLYRIPPTLGQDLFISVMLIRRRSGKLSIFRFYQFSGIEFESPVSNFPSWRITVFRRCCLCLCFGGAVSRISCLIMPGY